MQIDKRVRCPSRWYAFCFISAMDYHQCNTRHMRLLHVLIVKVEGGYVMVRVVHTRQSIFAISASAFVWTEPPCNLSASQSVGTCVHETH